MKKPSTKSSKPATTKPTTKSSKAPASKPAAKPTTTSKPATKPTSKPQPKPVAPPRTGWERTKLLRAAMKVLLPALQSAKSGAPVTFDAATVARVRALLAPIDPTRWAK